MLPSKPLSALGLTVLLSSLGSVSVLAPPSIRPIVAQSAPSTTFPSPNLVPSGTTVRIDGSSTMATQNQALKQQFERQFSGTNVMLNYGGSAAALQALREGKIDLAAIGRPLTWAERQEGFRSVPLNRGKIALMVSPENPFTGDITTRQFAQIFRGEITDWSELGGAPGRIRLIDRPDLSDLRTSFKTYPVFQEAPFQPGTNAIRLNADSTQAAIAQLGRDGISFAPANQVMGQSNVRIVPMHRTLPDDPRYPFSQPFYYVYKNTPSPTAANFLGFVTAPPGQQALLAAKPTEVAIAAGEPTTGTANSTTALNASPTAPNATQSGQTPGDPRANPAGTPNGAQSSKNLLNPGANPTGAPNTAQSGQTNPTTASTVTPSGQNNATTASTATPSGQNSPGSSTPQNPTIAASPAPQTAGSSTTAQNPTAIFPTAIDPATLGTKLPAWLWWLFPLGFGALLGILLLAGRRRSRRVAATEAAQTPVPPVPPTPAIAPPPPPPVGPSAFAPSSTEQDLAARTELVVNSDRASIRSNHPETNLADTTEATPTAELPVEAESPAPGIETDEITLNPAAGIAGGAMLGGAAIAAAGMRMRSEQPRHPATLESPESTESLTTFDQIDALDDQDAALAEVQAEDADVIDLDAVSSIAETSEASTELDQSTESLTTLDSVESLENQDLALMDRQGELIDLDAAPSIVEGAAEAIDPTLETELSQLEASLDREEEAVADSTALQETPFSLPRETAPDAIADADLETPLSEPLPINAANLAMGGAALAGLGFLGATTLGNPSQQTPSDDFQTDIEAAKFDIGQTDLSSETLAAVDAGLSDLPDGYGETRILLMPRDPHWAYTYWDIPNEAKVAVRQQGGQNLVLRLCDVTDIDLHQQAPHTIQQFDCDELARDWYLSIPVSDRDYLVEIGYLTASGQWLMLARSLPVRVPPVYPSDWLDEQFVTINWEEDLRGKQFGNLGTPKATQTPDTTMDDRLFPFTQGAEAQRVAGSLFGSMQQVPTGVLSSFVFPSGMGAWALPTPSGMGLSGMTLSGVGLTALPLRSRKFWFVADAELIVYGATEPDATVTIAGEPVQLSPEGTFRIHIPFPDGSIDYPILAVAKDGEQTRSIHLQFNRDTPKRNTNHKED